MYKYQIEANKLLDSNMSGRDIVEKLLKIYSPSHTKKMLGYMRKKVVNNMKLYTSLVLPYNTSQKMKLEYAKKLVENHKEIIKIDVVKHVDVFTRCLYTTIYRHGMALSAFTGRRMSEIFGTGYFSIYNEDLNLLEFSGLIKGHKYTETKTVIIPCLINVNEFMGAWLWFIGRNEMLYSYDHLENIEDHQTWLENHVEYIKDGCIKINNRLSKDLNILIKKILDPTKTFKDLRTIYITIAIAIYKPKTVSSQYYTSCILGHGENDLNTQNSYVKYRV